MKHNPFQSLPESVEVNGKIVPINPDFRVGVAIELEVCEPEPDATGLLMQFYRGSIPDPLEEATEQMIRFYAHQDGEVEPKSERKQHRRTYDFAQDADAILASFLEAYGVDLSTANLHWWTFKRLLCNLPPETPFMKRMYYRTVEVKKMSKSEREHVLKMRKLYALKKSGSVERTAEELDDAYKKAVWRRYESARKSVEQNA